jgi:hypothetical protein
MQGAAPSSDTFPAPLSQLARSGILSYNFASFGFFELFIHANAFSRVNNLQKNRI